MSGGGRSPHTAAKAEREREGGGDSKADFKVMNKISGLEAAWKGAGGRRETTGGMCMREERNRLELRARVHVQQAHTLK